MKRAILALLLFTCPLTQGMSAKKCKTVIVSKVTAKASVAGDIDGATLYLLASDVFLTYDHCENTWRHRSLLNWLHLHPDPCKAELQHITAMLKQGDKK